MLYTDTIRLDSQFYQRNAAIVAKQLLGCLLIVQRGQHRLAGWIVETEAYLYRDDPSCHAARGKTKSNATMFGKGGLLYVYSIHAKHCMNVVTGQEGRGEAVLIRAIQPIEGIAEMQRATGRTDVRMLARGPGRLCQALQIDRTWDGLDLSQNGNICIARWMNSHRPRIRISSSPRIGISTAQDLLLRFFVDGNRFVSGLHRLHQRKPVEELVNPFSEGSAATVTGFS